MQPTISGLLFPVCSVQMLILMNIHVLFCSIKHEERSEVKDTDSFEITVLLLLRNVGSYSAAFATAAAKGSSSLSLR